MMELVGEKKKGLKIAPLMISSVLFIHQNTFTGQQNKLYEKWLHHRCDNQLEFE